MLPFITSLLPGLISAGGKFLKRTASDIMSGKNVLKSIGSNAINVIKEDVPIVGQLAGNVAEGIYNAGKKLLKKKAKPVSKAIKNIDKMIPSKLKQTGRKMITGDFGAEDAILNS